MDLKLVDLFKETLLTPTSGSLNRDLSERVYIRKVPPNPNSSKPQPRPSGILGSLSLVFFSRAGATGVSMNPRCRYYGLHCSSFLRV